MSVAQFSPVLRQRIIEIYSDSSNKVDLASFGKKTRKQLFKEAPKTEDIRAKFKSADYHSSSITLEGMTALTSKLATVIEEGNTRAIVERFFNSPNFFSDFLSYVESREHVVEYGSSDFRIENVPEKNLRDAFISYLKENLKTAPKDVIDTLGKNVESGHLAGVFFLKLKTALGVSTQFSKDSDATYRDFTVSMVGLDNTNAIKALDSVLKAVLDADYLTSNLITQSQVFIDATKSVLGDSPRLTTELQFKADNKAAGDLLQQTGRQLNLLIQAASKGEMSSTEEAVASLVSTLKPVVALILQKAEELRQPLSSQGLYEPIVKNAKYLLEELINTPGSLTMRQGIEKVLVETIKHGRVPKPSTTKIKPKPIKQTHKEVVDISNVVKEFKRAVDILKRSAKASSVNGVVGVRSQTSKDPQLDLTNLQTLLQGSLLEAIRANMGTGNRRDVLNWRTGRFAESVQVERLSESRQGMITAFYSYMKNPYATFSAGGAQQYPKTRDPKLLISKSIRDIVSQRVANRLRAVSI